MLSLFLLFTTCILSGVGHLCVCAIQFGQTWAWIRKHPLGADSTPEIRSELFVLAITSAGFVLPLLFLTARPTLDQLSRLRGGWAALDWELLALDAGACLVFLPLAGFHRRISQKANLMALLIAASFALTLSGLVYLGRAFMMGD